MKTTGWFGVYLLAFAGAVRFGRSAGARRTARFAERERPFRRGGAQRDRHRDLTGTDYARVGQSPIKMARSTFPNCRWAPTT